MKSAWDLLGELIPHAVPDGSGKCAFDCVALSIIRAHDEAIRNEMKEGFAKALAEETSVGEMLECVGLQIVPKPEVSADGR